MSSGSVTDLSLLFYYTFTSGTVFLGDLSRDYKADDDHFLFYTLL